VNVGEVLVVSGDDGADDGAQHDEGKGMEWSRSPIASWDGEERRPKELQRTVTFGLGWGSCFAVN
jgi:hypothetical protein